MRSFLRDLVTLLLLVLPFAEVDDLTDRWLRVRYDLDEIEPALACDLECLAWRHTANLTFVIDDANLRHADILVHAYAGVARWHNASEALHALLQVRAWPRWPAEGTRRSTGRPRRTSSKSARIRSRS